MAKIEADHSLPLDQNKSAELVLSGPFHDGVYKTLVVHWDDTISLTLTGIRGKLSVTVITTSIVGLLLRMFYQCPLCEDPSTVLCPVLVTEAVTPLPG